MTGIQAAQEIRQLSAGTIGTLLQLGDHQRIDSARESYAVVIEASVRNFVSWMDAWEWVQGMNESAKHLPMRRYMD